MYYCAALRAVFDWICALQVLLFIIQKEGLLERYVCRYYLRPKSQNSEERGREEEEGGGKRRETLPNAPLSPAKRFCVRIGTDVIVFAVWQIEAVRVTGHPLTTEPSSGCTQWPSSYRRRVGWHSCIWTYTSLLTPITQPNISAKRRSYVETADLFLRPARHLSSKVEIYRSKPCLELADQWLDPRSEGGYLNDRSLPIAPCCLVELSSWSG